MSKKKKLKNNQINNLSPYRIQAMGDSEAELLIYGDIGESWYESVTAKDVVTQLQDLDVDTVNVRINSYGGNVADGIAIYNALRRHESKVNVIIEGVAVSAASLIAMAGDTVEMGANSLFMVHAPWTYVGGNSKEMRMQADLLDKYAEAMATSYSRKTGLSHDEILDILTDGEDHWFTATEAQDSGYIDIINDDGLEMAASGFNNSKYFANAPTLKGVSANKTVEREQSINVNIKVDAADLDQPTQQAAPVAATIKKEVIMTEAEKTQAAEKKAAEKREVEAKALAKDAERRTKMRAAFANHLGHEGVRGLMDTCLDDTAMTVSAASEQLLNHLGKDVTALGSQPSTVIVADVVDKFRVGAQSALLARAGLATDDYQNDYRGYSLAEMARKVLNMHGIDTTRMGKLDLVAAAFTHTTGDFGNLLINTANKAMLMGYDEADETFQAWTNVGELPDFKLATRADLDSFPALDKVPSGGEYKTATVGDRGETIQLATFGKLFAISRQSIINDDLGAFTRIPRKMGRAAVRTVGNLVYAILTGNPNMSDNVALFHATHNNLLTGAAVSTASVDAMRVAMAKQKDASKNASALNIRLANVIVPIALEGAAKVVRDSENEVGGSATTKNNTVPNSVRGTFEVISDARLDEASATNWYGAANSGMHDTIEVSYLDGNAMPRLEQQNGWNVDGTEFKVSLDAGVSPLDFRTLAKNPQ